ncbi:hypothetical protein AB0M46_42800 [Dactylosporangium sp. NPDC051485]|uniref:hypothetical protein n=1 Tax=Dactylosporangium sp. NPDC051485 TaxID=3154846 RepID=UPI00343B706C
MFVLVEPADAEAVRIGRGVCLLHRDTDAGLRGGALRRADEQGIWPVLRIGEAPWAVPLTPAVPAVPAPLVAPRAPALVHADSAITTAAGRFTGRRAAAAAAHSAGRS